MTKTRASSTTKEAKTGAITIITTTTKATKKDNSNNQIKNRNE